VPKLAAGTGASQAESTYAHLKDWNMTQKFVAMNFDTTASNTGEHNGACVLLEEKICRNHIAFGLQASCLGVDCGSSVRIVGGGGALLDTFFSKRIVRHQ
jgi:hypothetical protein